jgi:hypothetical protein
MAAPTADYHALDLRLADKTRLSFAPIDTMLKLKETFFSVGVHVVGNGRAAKSDRFFQDLLDRRV